MKAATMNAHTDVLRYADVPDPIVTNPAELLLTIKAAAIKHIDRSRSSGTHYSTEANTADAGTIIGSDGVGLLPDGRRVYAINSSGMVAEKAVVAKDRMVVVPAGLDDATAAALPNAVFGAAMALRFRASMQPGETVLINGATGVTGRIAVQIARYYGARKVIATGRNPESLQTLLALGADEVVSINQDEETFLAQIRTLHRLTPIDIIIDYLWGQTAELLLTVLKGQGNFTHPVRFVSVGAVAGDTVALSSDMLRSTNLYLSGSGLGSWTRQEVDVLFRDLLPEMFQLAAQGALQIETIVVPLHAIEFMYGQSIPAGKRVVITMN